jgi:hypothetical protein
MYISLPLPFFHSAPSIAFPLPSPMSILTPQIKVVAWSEDMNFMRRKKPLPELRKIVYTQTPQGPDTVDESPQTFTVMTYSIPTAGFFLIFIYIYLYIFWTLVYILADFLTTKFQFPYTTPETRNWETRKNEILKEILFYQPDVVCLQEVQAVFPPKGRREGDEVGDGEAEADDLSENDHWSFFF